MSRKPSTVQHEALQYVAASESKRLCRLPGGFWTTPELAEGPLDSIGAPTWSVGSQTVRAMEKCGWLKRCHVHEQEWRDERQLTDAGQTAAEAT